jgi:uncharacterized membrane protein (UPF0127 family)
MKRVLFVAVVFSLILAACGDGNKMTTVTFEDGTTVRCEVADTPAKQRAGMTIYDSVEEHQGMLFVYPEVQEFTSFWMPARMKFRIDIIFLGEDKRINTIHRNVPICESNSEIDCPSYISRQPTKYVLEVKAGFSDKRGLKINDTVSFDLP